MTPIDHLILALREWDSCAVVRGGVLQNAGEELFHRLKVQRLLRALPTQRPLTFLYLAAPYRHREARVEAYRAKAAANVAALLMSEGVWTYAPTAHGHALAVQNPELARPEWAECWLEHGELFLRLSHALAVLRLHGWEKSEGVANEIEKAKEWNLPVLYLDPRSGIEAFLREYREAIL